MVTWKSQKDEIVLVYYGINPRTFAVTRVTATRGGLLSGERNGAPLTHQCSAGAPNEAEVRSAFGLVDIFTTAPRMESTAQVREKVSALGARADLLRRG